MREYWRCGLSCSLLSAPGNTLLEANHLIGELLSAIESSGTFYLLALIEKGFREDLFRWIALRMLTKSGRTQEAFELLARHSVAAEEEDEEEEAETAL